LNWITAAGLNLLTPALFQILYIIITFWNEQSNTYLPNIIVFGTIYFDIFLFKRNLGLVFTYLYNILCRSPVQIKCLSKMCIITVKNAMFIRSASVEYCYFDSIINNERKKNTLKVRIIFYYHNNNSQQLLH